MNVDAPFKIGQVVFFRADLIGNYPFIVLGKDEKGKGYKVAYQNKAGHLKFDLLPGEALRPGRGV